MAAYELSIFKTPEEADSEIYEIFFNIAIEKLHLKQGGIRAPLFHPLDFFEDEKPFWERVINSVTEDDEKARFYGWAVSTVPLKELNATLAKKNVFPKGIEPSDFEAFMSLHARKAILHYLLGDANRCRTIISAAQAQLLFVKPFCDRYKLDIEVLKNYEKLAHVFGADSSDENKASFAVITSSSIKISEEMLRQKEGFLACQQVLLLDVLQLEKERKALEEKIEAFCVENHLDKKAIMDLAEKKEYAGSGGLREVINLAGEALALDAQKNEIDTVKQSIKLLHYHEAYEKIIAYLKENFSISSTFFAEKVIAICGHGLKRPYKLPLTEREYMTFLEKRLNTKLIEIKNEFYYKTAERKIFAIQNKSAFNSLEQLRNYLDYIMQVIQLGSYQKSIFNSETIDYSISVKKSVNETKSRDEIKIGDEIKILKKQKPIPSFLYNYYVQLNRIITQIDFEKELLAINSTYYMAIIRLKLIPQENDVHYKWHHKFLNQLQVMVQGKKVTSPPAALASSSSSSSVSFQAEDAKARISRSGTSGPIHPDSSPPQFK